MHVGTIISIFCFLQIDLAWQICLLVHMLEREMHVHEQIIVDLCPSSQPLIVPIIVTTLMQATI